MDRTTFNTAFDRFWKSLETSLGNGSRIEYSPITGNTRRVESIDDREIRLRETTSRGGRSHSSKAELREDFWNLCADSRTAIDDLKTLRSRHHIRNLVEFKRAMFEEFMSFSMGQMTTDSRRGGRAAIEAYPPVGEEDSTPAFAPTLTASSIARPASPGQDDTFAHHSRQTIMHQPEPHSMSFSSLMNDIETGSIKIPQFQRDFVWGKEKSAKLLDSILKGYPIGTFILWKTKEALRSVRNIGNRKLPDTPEGDYTQHVLDGQQRLTSLYASVRGSTVDREGKKEDFANLYINLIAGADEDLVLTDNMGRDPHSIVRIVDLLGADLTFLAAYPKELHARLSEYKKTLESYLFSIVLVREAPLDVATEIFTRINVTGKPLSVFEIMVAKTFDAATDFDLAERVDALLEDLSDVGYETIRPETILQTVSAILKKECAKKDILLLRKSDFIAAWPEAVSAIQSSVEYFRNYYRIPVSRLLPFGALLVPFSYFFVKHPDKPIGTMQGALEDFFWRVGLTGRYSFSLEGRLAQDIKKIDAILLGETPEYESGVDLSAEFIMENGRFSTSRSYSKALLCLLAYCQPKSFIDDSIVNLSNDWLKQANSKNYHHFFPKAYLRKHGYEDWKINHIANITIVDDFLNKRLIRDNPPEKYMKVFAKKNPHLAKTMKTHLIDSEVGWYDYDVFIRARCEAFSKELTPRIVMQRIDKTGQAIPEEQDIELEEAE